MGAAEDKRPTAGRAAEAPARKPDVVTNVVAMALVGAGVFLGLVPGVAGLLAVVAIAVPTETPMLRVLRRMLPGGDK